MYCHNCGREIPDSSTFCTFCGAQQGAARPVQTRQQPGHAAPEPVRRQPAPARQQQTQKPKRKWTAILIPVAVFFVAGIIGKFVVAPALQNKNDSAAPDIQPLTTIAPIPTVSIAPFDGTADTESTESSESSNPAYTEIFSGTRVFHMPIFFGMDVASFAMKDEDGTIICHDFGYHGDQVLEFSETWYYPGIAADQQDIIQNMTSAAQQEVDSYSDVACASVTYEYNEACEYFTIEYLFSDLDQPENMQAIYDLGIADGANGLSLAACEQSSLDAGYVKK